MKTILNTLTASDVFIGQTLPAQANYVYIHPNILVGYTAQ